MADAPTPIAGSSLQAGFLAAEINKGQESRRAGEANTARRQTAANTDAGDTVETMDADSRVFSESEGGGSQGRNFEETSDDLLDEPNANLAEPPTPNQGPSTSRLDINA